ncbi:MAG: PAS domain-containing protein [Myxococcales bacterium]|nr:PAS domain-containing protein [Myxococcales bacterium]MDD9965863.1 PAS domain-containing protein [Myxococcales bacterium]
MAHRTSTQGLVPGLGTWVWTPKEGRVEWSASLYEMLEIPSEVPASVELFFERVHPDDRSLVQQAAEVHARTGKTPLTQCRLLPPSGRIRHVVSSSMTMFDEDGEVQQLVGALIDLSPKAHQQRLVAAPTTAALSDESDVQTRLRHQLRANLAQVPRVEDVAKRLGMSTGSLQRHLAGSGTSFRQELITTRRVRDSATPRSRGVVTSCRRTADPHWRRSSSTSWAKPDR